MYAQSFLYDASTLAPSLYLVFFLPSLLSPSYYFQARPVLPVPMEGGREGGREGVPSTAARPRPRLLPSRWRDAHLLFCTRSCSSR